MKPTALLYTPRDHSVARSFAASIISERNLFEKARLCRIGRCSMLASLINLYVIEQASSQLKHGRN